eukprot:gene13516-28668_t
MLQQQQQSSSLSLGTGAGTGGTGLHSPAIRRLNSDVSAVLAEGSTTGTGFPPRLLGSGRSREGSLGFDPSPSGRAMSAGGVSWATMLATGSTGGQAFIYDISKSMGSDGSTANANTNVNAISSSSFSEGGGGSSPFCWQRLDGHQGKVHGALFSPTDPHILVTFGADGVLKAWAPRRRRANSIMDT